MEIPSVVLDSRVVHGSPLDTRIWSWYVGNGNAPCDSKTAVIKQKSSNHPYGSKCLLRRYDWTLLAPT